MKKQSIILTGLLIVASGLQGATLAEIQDTLNKVTSTFAAGALNKNLTTAQQNLSLNMWNDAFAKAKAFVIDNSKNLVGMKDSDITNALAGVEKGSMDFINAIKMIRGLSNPNDLQKQSNYLMTIKGNLRKATDKLAGTSMTLEKKQHAKAVVLAIESFLGKMIDGINGIVLEKMRMSAPSDLPPVYRG